MFLHAIYAFILAFLFALPFSSFFSAASCLHIKMKRQLIIFDVVAYAFRSPLRQACCSCYFPADAMPPHFHIIFLHATFHYSRASSQMFKIIPSQQRSTGGVAARRQRPQETALS